MTEKLYYKNSYMRKFEAHVLACDYSHGKYRVLLDRTAFYPGGGGQPVDEGILDTIRVQDVYEEGDKIYHILDEPLGIGTCVLGEIDFENRFDYMQQHSGEHILSGVVNALYGFNNVGFHLSKHYMTADFDGELTPDQLEGIEQSVNQAIYQNKQIQSVIHDHTELVDISYRSKLDLKGQIRLVTVAAYDVCACCGTHVQSAGEVGLVKIIGAQKYKGGMRLTILCGDRARRDYERKSQVISQLSQMLSAKPDTVVEGVERLYQEMNMLKQVYLERTQTLLSMEAKAYAHQAVVCIKRDDLSGDELRRFCTLLIECNEVACLVVSQEEKGLRYVLGRQDGDVRGLCQEMNQVLGGKGGGKPTLCQGTLQTDFNTLYTYWRGLE